VARQEQDFNKETNQQSTTLFIKDSHHVTIDLTEIQSARVLQLLLALSDRHARPNPLDPVGEKGRVLLTLFGRLPVAELQDVEVNSLLQGQSIHIENCTDVKITVNQIEVEKVVELGLEVLRLQERRSGDKTSTGESPAWS
jgi:hypothetical protein